MATTVGEIQYKVSIDTKDLKSGLASSDSAIKASAASNKASLGGIGNAFAVMGKAAVAGTAAAGAAVVKITKDAVSSYADYEQLVGGVETLFKNSANIVQKYAQDAYKTAGLSANQYMNTVTSFSASLLQGLGGDTAKAAEYGNRAVIDMADNANKMGTDISRIQDAYQGFAKQNYTMLDNLKLGYGGTKTEMQRLLADAEKLSGKKFDVSNFADITEAIHIVQESMGIAGTTALEAENTISGSLNTLKASWSDLLTSLAGGGEDFDKQLQKLIKSFGQFAKNVVPVISTVLQSIPSLIEGIVPVVIAEIPKLIAKLLPVAVNTLVSLVNQIVAQLPQIIIVLINALTEAVNQLAAVLPNMITTLVNVLTAPDMLSKILQAGIQLFMALVMAIPDIIVALADAIPTIIDNLVSFISNPENIMMLLQAGVQIFMALVAAIPRVLPSLLKALGSILTALPRYIVGFGGAIAQAFGQIIQKGVDKVVSFVTSMTKAAGDLIKGLVKGIGNGAKAVVKKIKEICSGALDAIKNFFGISSPSKVMAQMGGYMMQGLENGIASAGAGVVSEAQKVNEAVADAFGVDDMAINPTVGAGNFSSNTIGSSSDTSGRFGSVVVNQNVVANTPVDMQIINQRLGNAVRRATA